MLALQHVAWLQHDLSAGTRLETKSAATPRIKGKTWPHAAQPVKYASSDILMTNTILLGNLFQGNITADNF
jgi:hypothetical protein